MVPDPHIISSQDVCSADVLLGRGKLVHNHAGNTVYRMDIKFQSMVYKSLKCIGRDVVAREIFDRVHQRGGRFLRRTSNEVLWEKCPDRLALTKVKQALRDSIRQDVSTRREPKALDGGTEGVSNVVENTAPVDRSGPGLALSQGHLSKEARTRTQGHRELLNSNHQNPLLDVSAPTDSDKKDEGDVAVRERLLLRRTSEAVSQANTAKRARRSPAVFNSFMPNSPWMELGTQLPGHRAFVDCTARQMYPVNEQPSAPLLLHRLHQARTHEPSLFHNHAFLQSTPTSQLGAVANESHLLLSGRLDDSSRCAVSRIPSPRRRAETLPRNSPRTILPPDATMDNEVALVLRKLREGYIRSSLRSSVETEQGTTQVASLEESGL